MRRSALWIAVTLAGIAGGVAAFLRSRVRPRACAREAAPADVAVHDAPGPSSAAPSPMPRRRREGRRFAGAVATLLILLPAMTAYAFWTAEGSGADTASGGSLTSGSVSVPSTSNGANTVTWTSQASLDPANDDNGEITYLVQRRTGSGTFSTVTSGDCAGSHEYDTTSCVDVVAASGTYSYRVVAIFNSWDAVSAATGNVTATVDTTNPTVSSINRVGTVTTTNASSVQFLVTFSEVVNGVDPTDFQLAGTATSGASIASVSGSGTTRTVTVNTGSANGTLGLNLVDDDSIVDTAATPRPLGGAGTGNGNKTGATFTMDKTAPTMTALKASSTTATNASSVTFSATFSESVTGVDAGDFQLTTTGTLSGVSISAVSTGTTTRTITVSTGTGDGTIAIKLVDDDTITDTATNKLGGTGTGNGNFSGTSVATIDRTPPALSSVQFFDTDLNGKVNQVKATFTEALVASTATSPWTLSATPSGGTLSTVAVSSTVATLTLTEGSGAQDTGPGSFTATLAASSSGIRDAAGNQASFATTAVADKARPVVIGLTDTDGSTNGRLQTGDTLTATFSEAIAAGVPATPTLTLSRSSSTSNVTLLMNGFNSAAASLGSTDYLTASGTVVFAGTAAAGAGNTVKITAGSCSSTATLCNTVGTGTGTTFSFVPSTLMQDAAANTAGGSRAAGFALF